MWIRASVAFNRMECASASAMCDIGLHSAEPRDVGSWYTGTATRRVLGNATSMRTDREFVAARPGCTRSLTRTCAERAHVNMVVVTHLCAIGGAIPYSKGAVTRKHKMRQWN